MNQSGLGIDTFLNDSTPTTKFPKEYFKLKEDLAECQINTRTDTFDVIAIISGVYMVLCIIFIVWYLGYVKGKSIRHKEMEKALTNERRNTLKLYNISIPEKPRDVKVKYDFKQGLKNETVLT
ncbi:unnamed protein product [Gordionus sp. m RMFG-2023]